MYSIEEIEEATSEFDEDRKIGQGGYGSVYYGVIGDQVCIYVINIHPFSISYCHLSKIASNTQEVAIKKMRSNKSKEFLAELKVLCKIHHINVVRNDALVFFFFFLLCKRVSIAYVSGLAIAGGAVGLRQRRRPPLLGLRVYTQRLSQRTSS